MDYLSIVQTKYKGTKLLSIFEYADSLFKNFPFYSMGYDKEQNWYYISIETTICLYIFEDEKGSPWLYCFGEKIMDSKVDLTTRFKIEDLYLEIRKMFMGLNDPTFNGYRFNVLNIYDFTEEFLGTPKLDNLFYFQEYVPRRYLSKANNNQITISNRILEFKENYTEPQKEVMEELNKAFGLLDKTKHYYVCSIPGHKETWNNEINAFDNAVLFNGLPKNFSYIKDLIFRIYSVPKKSFGFHNKSWEEETMSLGFSSSRLDLIRNNTVIILDDITTTGCSMQAVRFQFLLFGITNIIFIAYGKTTHL